jgi:hypothetical protein
VLISKLEDSDVDELGQPELDPFVGGAVRRVLKDVEW